MTQQQAEFEIKNLQQALTEWRVSHRAPVPIPAEIWSGAVRVATVLGVASVARELRIDDAKLKRLVVGDMPVPVPPGNEGDHYLSRVFNSRFAAAVVPTGSDLTRRRHTAIADGYDSEYLADRALPAPVSAPFDP